MWPKSFLRPFTPYFRQADLRTVLVLPFVLQIVGAVGLVGYLSYTNGRQAVEKLAIQLETKISDRLQEKILNYLAKPHEFHQITRSSIRSGMLDPSDFTALEQFFAQQIRDHDLVSYAYFGNTQGDVISVKEDEDGRLISRIRDASTGGERREYLLDDEGNRVEFLKSRSYDARSRPWYQAAATAQQPTWSSISAAFADNLLEVNAVAPLYDETGSLQGVLGSELSLTQIKEFLQTLDISASGQVFIVEHSGEMVATSTAESPFVVLNSEMPGSEEDENAEEVTAEDSKSRLVVTQSQNPLTRATANYLLEQFEGFHQIVEPQNLSFRFNGEHQLIRALPLRDKWGLDWLLVVAIPESDFMGQIYANTRTTVLLCIGALVLSLVMGGVTARWIARPIQRLNRAAKAVADGNLAEQVEITRVRELEELGASFNDMATQLNYSFQELETLNVTLVDRERQLAAYNRTLEEEVQQRTQKLLAAEKMAALGQLTAGVAHELNTPLGAIRAANENVVAGLQQSFQHLPQVLLRLTTDQVTAFLNLLALIQKPPKVFSFREERQLRQTLKKTLSEQGVEPVEPLADVLSKLGIVTANLDTLTSVLKTSQNVQILEAAYAISMTTTNSQTIRTAVDRAARIVFALKSYTHQDLPGNAKTSISEGIEAVLTLYQNYLKRGIELTKNYETISEVPCNAEDLMQVWTNLIHNALQAMDYQGQLEIKVAQKDQQAVVTISDTGHGISPEHQERIFEPFFTTKSKGEGTGLGLDIVRRIIEKYQGRIEVMSQPGHTVFQVWLPLERTPSASAL